MKPSRVFLSHSSQEKEFTKSVTEELRDPSLAPWIDSEQIITGDDILDELGKGLSAMDVLVFLVSQASLQSEWVQREIKYAVRREIEEKRVLVLPFIIDDTAINELQWFLRHRNASRVTADSDGPKFIARTVKQVIERRSSVLASSVDTQTHFKGDSRLDEIIRDVDVGDWEAAYRAALEVLKATDKDGRNDLLEILLRYQDLSNEDDRRWAASLTIESLAQLAPWLFSHKLISELARHKNYSVRSSAAAICMDLAQFAPLLVPVDVVLNLATPHEDWYVMAPATAALKALARSRPAVLTVFFVWLRSSDSDVREHAAHAIWEIAEKEPEILDPKQIKDEISKLEQIGDRNSRSLLAKALPLVQEADRVIRFKYGL